MSLEINKAIARRFFEEVYNQRNLAVLDEILSPEVINHNTGVRGLETARKFITANLVMFPDVQVTLEDLIAEGDKVVVRGTDHFTNPRTGKKTALTWIEIMRIEAGKVVEAWAEMDMSALADILPGKK
jgi:predicted SnoaL-like aldol condensation-catalyzing enzyme